LRLDVNVSASVETAVLGMRRCRPEADGGDRERGEPTTFYSCLEHTSEAMHVSLLHRGSKTPRDRGSSPRQGSGQRDTGGKAQRAAVKNARRRSTARDRDVALRAHVRVTARDKINVTPLPFNSKE
jgi:hypothetical protein